jgi:nucleoside-diphosphate-sugar epimerase
MTDRKVLVTGGCGFVGRHFIADLAQEEGVENHAIDDLSTGQHPLCWEWPKACLLSDMADGFQKLKFVGTDARIMFAQCDFMAVALSEFGRVADFGLRRLPQFDEVYYLASVVGGRNVIDNFPLAVGIDLALDSVFFLRAAKVSKPGRILYASSSAAYPPWCMYRSLVASPVLPRVSADPDGGRHAERRHPVEHVAANFCLGPLIEQSPGAKPPADDGLVAIHCGFDQAPPIVA